MDVRDKVILVVGLARSGCAAGGLLRRQGARVIGIDDAQPEALAARWGRSGLEGQAAAAFDEVITGGDWKRLAHVRLDGVALSPGVPTTHAGLHALAGDPPIWGELEWGARFCPARAIAVTGTNGKTTTTELVAHLLRSGGFQAEALGNVGRPLCERAESLDADAVAVLEVSSFQLETVDSFRPAVGVVLNLAPDHLDRYADLASYFAAKRRLVEQLPSDGTFVTWTGCAEALAWDTPGPRLLFGDGAAGADVVIHEDALRVVVDGRPQRVARLADLTWRSPPNVLNAAAAVAACWPLLPDPAALGAGLVTFEALAHRHQQVGELARVAFVNDSKATNVHAVCAGLRGYPRKVVLIAGGRGKGERYEALREVFDQVRALVTIGEEGPAIAAAVSDLVPVHAAGDMTAAVRRAYDLARPDATVLLSPACASFDMFDDYQARGEAFAAAYRDLAATLEEGP